MHQSRSERKKCYPGRANEWMKQKKDVKPWLIKQLSNLLERTNSHLFHHHSPIALPPTFYCLQWILSHHLSSCHVALWAQRLFFSTPVWFWLCISGLYGIFSFCHSAKGVCWMASQYVVPWPEYNWPPKVFTEHWRRNRQQLIGQSQNCLVFPLIYAVLKAPAGTLCATTNVKSLFVIIWCW